MRRWIAFVVFVLALVPSHVAAQSGNTPITGPASISGDTVVRVLAMRPNSPLRSIATFIYDQAQRANVDVAFALAMWLKEAEFGTTGASADNRNPGNMTCDSARYNGSGIHSGCSGRWAVYDSWEDGVVDWFYYINDRYISRGIRTVRALIEIYAPAFENNVDLYVEQVETWMREWGSGTVGTAPEGDTGGYMDDWVRRPADQLVYNVERLIASTLWGINQAGLWLCDLIERLRTLLVTGGFRPAIDAVANDMLGVSRVVLELGMIIGLLLIMLAPVLRVRFVNMRKLLVLAVLLPVLLPMGGAIFQDMEEMRANVGSLLYDAIFDRTQQGMAGLNDGTGGSGTTENMGPLVAFNPASGEARHAVDVAAAYLYAVRQDVIDPANPAPEDLPDAFAETYFPYSVNEMANGDPTQRQEAIDLAGQGILRMGYGILLVIFAICESMTNLIFTMGLGFLLIALVFALVFGFFAPVEHMVGRLGHQVIAAFAASWGVSVLQGILMATVFVIAGSRNAVGVLGIGLLAVILGFVFLLVAFRTMWSAAMGATGAITGGALDASALAGGVALAQTSIGNTGAALTNVAQGGYEGTTRRLGQAAAVGGELVEGSAAYRLARRSGNTRTYSAAFAGASISPRLGTLGALANAMHGDRPIMREQIEPGLYAARGDKPLSLGTQRRVRRDGARTRSGTS